MSHRIRKQTKYLTVSAMLCALGTILLALGALIDVLDLTVAALASLLCVYAVIEIGGPYPVAVWLVTSCLSLLLLPVKTPAIVYAMFAGFYPIVKAKLEGRKGLKSAICWLLKLVVFHVCIAGIVLILMLFLPSLLENDGPAWFPALLYVMGLVCFVLYDLALTRVISFYLARLHHKFRIR